jgi:hypothetical protein
MDCDGNGFGDRTGIRGNFGKVGCPTTTVQPQIVVQPPAVTVNVPPAQVIVQAPPVQPSAPPPPVARQVIAAPPAAPSGGGAVAPPRSGDGGLLGGATGAGLPGNAEFGVVLGFLGLAAAGYAFRMRASNS